MLRICPEFRDTIITKIEELAAEIATIPFPPDSALTDAGLFGSVVKEFPTLIPPGCIQVAFTVTTDAVGLEYTAVDYEAGAIGGGASSAAGDIFYAEPDGFTLGFNYLWHQAEDLGIEPGSWVNGISTDLADLSDNVNALDSSFEGISPSPDNSRNMRKTKTPV